MVALALAVFLSGGAALVYQVAWQRILLLHAGVGVYSVALITAAFLGGLGLGSQLAGRWSARLEPEEALRAFAILELAVAGFAAASPWLYYDLLYERGLWLPARGWGAGLVHFGVLAVPTTLMGMSLPFLVRSAVRSASSAPRSVGRLYGVNVLGAACGALLTPWVLIRLLGLRGAIDVGVAANAAAGLLALASRPRALVDPERPAPQHPPPGRRHPLWLWLLLYAATGFTALGLEVVWFRLIEIGVKGTAFTFGTVLALFLSGVGAGTLIATRVAAARREPLRDFLLVQGALLLWASGAVAAVVRAPADLPFLRSLVEYWSRRQGISLGWDWEPGLLAGLYVAWPLFLFAVPTLLMGVSFVLLQRAVQDDPRTSGRKVGALQAANIAGNVAGALVVGLLCLDRFGSAGTLRGFACLGVVWAVLGGVLFRRRLAFVALAAALVASAVAMPDQQALWRRLHGADAVPAWLDEDATAVIAVTQGEPARWWIWMSGRSQSSLPFGGVHTWLGALPALVHPAPRDVAIIGLGSGDTAWASGCRSETDSVTVFELSAPQRRLLERVAPLPPFRHLRRFLDDPRVRLVLDDGRNRIQRGDRLYDLIEADALLPDAAGSGNVYSLEFFEAMASRLRPGGLMCTWAPTPRVAASFARAFPHAVAFNGGEILVGSRDRIVVDPLVWQERLAAGPGDYLGHHQSARVARALRSARPLDRRALDGVDANRDLDPRDEFARP